MTAGSPAPELTPSQPGKTIRPAPETTKMRGLSLRIVLIAALLAPLTAYWAANQLLDTIFSLMVPPVIMTLGVALLNMPLRKIFPRFALTEGELILFYGMHAVMCAICAEWMAILQPALYSFGLFHDSDSRWDKYIAPYASKWFFVPASEAPKLQDFRYGGYGFSYFLSHLPFWFPYIASWTLLVTLICGAMLCVNSLMRDEWTTREKLAFPIIQVPIEVAKIGAGKSNLLKSPLFRGAFGIMFAIDILNGLHFMYPSLPLINVRFIGDLHQYFQSPPFSSIGWTPIGIFPYMAVIGFFMPTDLLFSCIFFFFFRKFMQVFTYSIGYTESAGVFGGGGLVPSAPYFSEQSWGAFIGLFVTAGWVARSYLKEVWQKILHGGGDKSDVPPRFAFIGLLVCLAGLSGIGLFVGIPLWMVLFETILFLMFSAALTRMRAQIGAPSHEMAFMGPNQLMVDFIGTQALPQAGISRMVTTFFIYNRLHRSHPMPHQLETMKMGESARVSQRGLFAAILFATVLGSVLGHMSYISKGYLYGAQNGAWDSGGVAAQIIDQHRPANPVGILFVFIGFLVVLGLDFIRFRLPGFPLHPVGYALAMNFGLDYFWFGLVIVWLIKLFIERYYGLKGHGKLREVAIGIILAEFCAEAIWSVFAMWTHTATYSISINGRLGWDQ